MTDLSNALQRAVYERLVADTAVAALIAARVYDHPPANATLPYVSFGASDYVPMRADDLTGRDETLQIDVWSTAPDGKRECKAIVGAVVAALDGAAPDLVAGAVTGLTVELVRIIDDPDGVTTHGIVQITAALEDD